MNVWLILWGALAVSLVSFMVWTFSILMRQKRAWSVYAEKRKLRYKSNSLMDSPEISGVIGDHTVELFASEHASEDGRGFRKLTAIEVNLNSTMPVDGGVASSGMIPILKTLQFKVEYLPKHKKWKKSYVAVSDNRNVLESYLNDERVAALCELMEVENSWLILVFKGDAMLLRLDLADPLYHPKKLDQVVKKIINVAGVLELKKGESKLLKSEEVKAVSKGIELEVDEDILEAPSVLSLEDEAAEVLEKEPKEGDVLENEKAEDDQPSASSKKSEKE